MDWERWVGVRGAAVLGGVVLALAGFLFLKFSIEQGLIPPTVRVALGFLAGVACIGGSEALRKREQDYQATANALAGAGIVLLYAAVWAARVLYGLIGSGPAFFLMVLVTVACGVLSWRYGSLVIAVLGLVGGFATPALLSTGEDHPFGLFGYLLMLDVGILVLAAKRGWSRLVALSLGFTYFYQAAWIFGRMGADRLILGLGILALFTGVYAIAGRKMTQGEEKPEDGTGRSPGWWVQAAAVFLPFTFALYFAGKADLGPHLVPTAALLLLLTLLAGWIGNEHKQPLFAQAAAAGGVAVVAVWCFETHFVASALAWEVVTISLGLALVWQVFAERGLFGASRAAGIAAGGFFVVLMLVALETAATGDSFFWPWFVGQAGLAALLCRQGMRAGQGQRQVLAALGLGLGIGLYFLAVGGAPAWPVLFCALAAALAFQGLEFLGAGGAQQPADRAGRRGEAAGLLPLVLLVLFLFAPKHALGPEVFLGTTLGLALLAVLAATRMRAGGWYFAAVALLACNHWLWSQGVPHLPDAGAVAWIGLGIQALAVLLFTAWPFLTGASFAQEPWAWYGTALAGPAWFLSLKILFIERFGDTAIGILPVILGALSLAAAWRSRELWTAEDSLGKSRLVWFAAVALGFLSLAIPLQLEKEWITLGWALEGLAVTALWKRLDHPGLKYFGLTLLTATTVRLVANPELLGYYPRGGWPVLNWLLYTYLVPAAALVGTARLLGPSEVERARRWEKGFYRGGRPLGAIACALAAILVVFAWINLAIFDFFSSGQVLEISFERLAARDLTTSLAWIAYALLLLALGMAKGSRGLRWISLGFLVLSIGKVFLYDLGELEDLYRVASLVGLAVSLILVSLAYQRFVFSASSAETLVSEEDP